VNLETLLARGEAMNEELGREYYLTGAGLKADPEFQAIYDRYAEVASDEALSVARASGSLPILEWAMDVRVGRLVAPLEERQLVWEQDAEVRFNGHAVPYLRVPIELANSADRDYRTALDTARAAAGAGALGELRRERFEVERAAMRSLELGDYVDAVGELAGVELDRLGESAREFLARTAPLYDENLARLVRQRMGVPVDELVRADSAWLFRADRYDAAFPSERLLDAAVGQMQEMGLDATQQGRVRFDTEEREGKQPRAFCVPVRVPQEVYLVLRPRGGHADYRTFWHELGHAMHFASVSPELPFDARCLGDNSVTEAFAMLWDHLTLDPGWLVRYGSLERRAAAELAFELAVSELFLVRRYAAKVVYELELHRSDMQGMAGRYVELLSDATRFRYHEGDHLLDVDPGFYVARYLRAWQLEAALAHTLVERHDADWYRNPAAGEVVQALMGRGQADPADRLAEDATGEPLTFEYVAKRLERALA
jgi:hypothetical protein